MLTITISKQANIKRMEMCTRNRERERIVELLSHEEKLSRQSLEIFSFFIRIRVRERKVFYTSNPTCFAASLNNLFHCHYANPYFHFIRKISSTSYLPLHIVSFVCITRVVYKEGGLLIFGVGGKIV